MNFGSRLKEIRKEKGLSQNQVAEELLVSRQSVSKWENDFCYPELENFHRLCKLYDKTLEELLYGIDVDKIEIKGILQLENNEIDKKDSILLEKDENREIVLNTIKYDFNSLSFISFVPFLGMYFIFKSFSERINKQSFFWVNLLISIFVTIFFIIFIYCEIPKTSRMNTY